MPMRWRSRCQSVLAFSRSPSKRMSPLNRFEPVEGAQQGALAAAARSQDDDHFPGVHREADLVQYPVLAELFADSIELKQRCHTALPHCCSSRREASESG